MKRSMTTETGDERSARIVLVHLCPPGDRATGGVLARVGAVETLRLIGSDDAVPGMDATRSDLWRARISPHATPERVDHALATVAKQRFTVTIPGDRDWPRGVNDLGPRAPYALWVAGNARLLATPLPQRATLTGTRFATDYGQHVTTVLARELTQLGKHVVSGDAAGIEEHALRGALAAGGSPVTVLSTGIDLPHGIPRRELLHEIATAGVVVSEHPPGATPDSSRSLRSQQVVAAFSGAVVVTEAQTDEPTAAHHAATLSRPVGAVPGPVTSQASAGAHRLVRDGTATIVGSSADVMALLDSPPFTVDCLPHATPTPTASLAGRSPRSLPERTGLSML